MKLCSSDNHYTTAVVITTTLHYTKKTHAKLKALKFLRQVFSRFLDCAETSGELKKNRLEKLVSPVKRSSWFYASTLQNFARRYFYDVNKVSIVFSRTTDIKTGESIRKRLNYKSFIKSIIKVL